MQVLIDGVLYVPAQQPAKQEPATADRIRAAIAQLHSQNTPWPDVAVFVQTWVLQRALTPEEWEVAYAAGFPRPTPTPAPEPAVPQVDGNGNVTFLEGGIGQNIVIEGPGERYLTIPDGFAGSVSFEVAVNSDGRTKFPYSAYLNGELIGTRDTVGVIQHSVPVSAGQRYTLRIDQASDSAVTTEFRAYRA